ncbi:uncharacterized protein LOC134207433 [Armigeres subalbatus]|uniref:uncharacterized protein LOC134207433 n=1 Tax=Armigeres subalbatus TaxID=124917 RepID=UPI002ED195CD
MDLTHTLLRTPLEEDYATDVPGEDAAAAEVRKAKLKKRIEDDVEALDQIVMIVNNDVLNKLIGLEYAKEAMDTLVKTYQKAGTAAMVNMRDRLYTIKHRNHGKLSAIFDEYDLIIRELDRMGSRMTTSEKMHALLIAIPDKYRHVKGALIVLSNEELCPKPVTEVKRMFLDAEAGEGERKEQKNVTLESKKKMTRCFGCNEFGHYKNK